MTALSYDLMIDQGADFVVSIPILDPDGAPQSLVGWTARGQVRQTHGGAVVLHDLEPVSSAATVTVTVDAASSAAWDWRVGVYDIELVDPSEKVIRLVQGRVIVSPEVTRA